MGKAVGVLAGVGDIKDIFQRFVGFQTFQSVLLYNRIGKRIVGVGRTTGGGDASRNIRVPDSYEMPRDVFDLTASKRFGPLEIKLAIRDLLNQQVTFKQFSDVMVQGEGRRIEQVTRRYRPGMNLNFSATLTL